MELGLGIFTKIQFVVNLTQISRFLSKHIIAFHEHCVQIDNCSYLNVSNITNRLI